MCRVNSVCVCGKEQVTKHSFHCLSMYYPSIANSIFYQFIKQAKHIHGNRYTLNSNTFTTRSENSYKRSGARTPSNVREFKRFSTAVQTSSEETRRVRINVHGKYPANCILSTV